MKKDARGRRPSSRYREREREKRQEIEYHQCRLFFKAVEKKWAPAKRRERRRRGSCEEEKEEEKREEERERERRRTAGKDVREESVFSSFSGVCTLLHSTFFNLRSVRGGASVSPYLSLSLFVFFWSFFLFSLLLLYTSDSRIQRRLREISWRFLSLSFFFFFFSSVEIFSSQAAKWRTCLQPTWRC